MSSHQDENYVDTLLEGYQEEPIILIGEDHTEREHVRAEEAIIEELEPEVVALEFYGQKDAEELEPHIGRGKYLSLGNIKTYFEENFEDSQVFKDYEGLLNEISSSYEELTPKDVEETNIYQFMGVFNTGFSDIVGQIQARKTVEKLEYEKWHADDEEVDYSKDDKLLELEKALNTLENIEEGLERIDQPYKESPVTRKIYEMNREGSGVQMKGADVASEKRLETSNKRRERVMAERIEEAAELSGPVVGIIGKNHLKPVQENIENGKARKIVRNIKGTNKVFTVDLCEQLGENLSLFEAFKHREKL